MRGAGNQIQYALGDDCRSSGPRRSGRQSLSTALLIGGMRLSLFCNARRKSRRCETSPRCCETKDGISSRSGPRDSNAAGSTRGRRRRVVAQFFRVMQCEAHHAFAEPNSRPPPPRKAPVPKAPWEVLLRRKLSACSGAVENFKSPKHHDDGRYQRGRHQHTFQGSDSHPLTLRFPAPLAV